MNTLAIAPAAAPYSQRVQNGYRLANLTDVISQIRSPGRYNSADGVNVLTTGELGRFDCVEAGVQVVAAAAAGLLGHRLFSPRFSHPLSGLSHGLNPYTDWTMSALREKPRHTYLFLGLDFYDIAALSKVGNWETYLQDPFASSDPDPFWQRVWAWIMNRTVIRSDKSPVWEARITAADAAAFMEADGGAFIFHNLIPYLRPAGTGSTEKGWPEREWKKASIRNDVIKDLSLLRGVSAGRVVAHCTKADAVKALRSAGFPARDIVCWSAHPSRVFHPSTLYKRGLYFKPVCHGS